MSIPLPPSSRRWVNPEPQIVPPSQVSTTKAWMISAGWPRPETFSSDLVREGVDWEGRRAAQDAYEDTLNSVAFEATHPHSGRFSVSDVATVAPCAARDVGLALYLLDFTDQRAANIAADPRGV